MANSPQALKRAKQSEKSRQQNMTLRTRLRTHIKRVVYRADELKFIPLQKKADPRVGFFLLKNLGQH